MSTFPLKTIPGLIWPDVFKLTSNEAFPHDYSRAKALADAFSYRGLILMSAPPSWVNHHVLCRIEDAIEISGSDVSWDWASKDCLYALEQGGERAEWWRASIGS